jgi:hypothetical protein
MVAGTCRAPRQPPAPPRHELARSARHPASPGANGRSARPSRPKWSSPSEDTAISARLRPVPSAQRRDHQRRTRRSATRRNDQGQIVAEVREHDQTSALAAAVERARIARDMHDSVARHLTVIVALSDGALAAVTRAPAQASDAIRGVPAPPGRRSPRPAACSASCEPRAGWNYGSRSRACPTLTACSPGSGRRGCRSGTNAAARPGTPRPASSWSSPGSFRKP